MIIQEWLTSATTTLISHGIKTARLDALIFLSDELQKDKAWVLAHPEYELSDSSTHILQSNLKRREQREPIAYIRGFQEFFGHSFQVTKDTLIPRPETETTVELLLALPYKPGDRLLDVGTGSGCIAIAAKLARPDMEVFATDISTAALTIARHNAKQLGAAITFAERNLLSKVTNGPFQYIIANLPYVDVNWICSPETAFEPDQALFAENNGCTYIFHLLDSAAHYLLADGHLLLEADPRQHPAIIAYAQDHDLYLHAQQDFALVFRQKP